MCVLLGPSSLEISEVWVTGFCCSPPVKEEEEEEKVRNCFSLNRWTTRTRKRRKSRREIQKEINKSPSFFKESCWASWIHLYRERIVWWQYDQKSKSCISFQKNSSKKKKIRVGSLSWTSVFLSSQHKKKDLVYVFFMSWRSLSRVPDRWDDRSRWYTARKKNARDARSSVEKALPLSQSKFYI